MLLDTEAFSSTINQLVDASFQSKLGTARDIEAEQAYQHYRALVDIVSLLRQRRRERRDRRPVR